MEELQRVLEAEALFMDALGGEFKPPMDPKGSIHTLARLVRNMLLEQAELPVGRDGEIEGETSRDLTWAPATAYLGSVPFEMRSFGKYGQRGQALHIPVRLSGGIQREGFGIRSFRIEFFHPVLFEYNTQPTGPEKGLREGGYLEITSHSYGDFGDHKSDSSSEKVGLCEVGHGQKARDLVTELAEKAFCDF